MKIDFVFSLNLWRKYERSFRFEFMSDNDFVSVTIVTYNSGRFIKRCLESVLEQRYRDKEIIVIDNASTDGTTDILEQFEIDARSFTTRRTSVSLPRRTRPSGSPAATGS